MGGVDADGWLEAPERPAVIVGTQDMLLSRALMRGYATSRAARHPGRMTLAIVNRVNRRCLYDERLEQPRF